MAPLVLTRRALAPFTACRGLGLPARARADTCIRLLRSAAGRPCLGQRSQLLPKPLRRPLQGLRLPEAVTRPLSKYLRGRWRLPLTSGLDLALHSVVLRFLSDDESIHFQSARCDRMQDRCCNRVCAHRQPRLRQSRRGRNRCLQAPGMAWPIRGRPHGGVLPYAYRRKSDSLPDAKVTFCGLQQVFNEFGQTGLARIISHAFNRICKRRPT